MDDSDKPPVQNDSKDNPPKPQYNYLVIGVWVVGFLFFAKPILKGFDALFVRIDAQVKLSEGKGESGIKYDFNSGQSPTGATGHINAPGYVSLNEYDYGLVGQNQYRNRINNCDPYIWSGLKALGFYLILIFIISSALLKLAR